VGLAAYHYQEITYLGWLDIIIEVIIVVLLAIIELRAASSTKKNELRVFNQ